MKSVKNCYIAISNKIHFLIKFLQLDKYYWSICIEWIVYVFKNTLQLKFGIYIKIFKKITTSN